MRYSDYRQCQLDIASGRLLDSRWPRRDRQCPAVYQPPPEQLEFEFMRTMPYQAKEDLRSKNQ